MTKLYPLKFHPILKQRVWGGYDLVTKLGKSGSTGIPLGESWEISGVEEDISIVSNGFLEGNDLNDLVEIYLGDLTGDSIYEKYGNEFPLLIKILDIQESLSLQVHPDDITARDRHNSYGKTECWYIMEASPNSKIYLGLNRDLTPQELFDKCNNDTIIDNLNVITPVKGDIIYIKPGTLHAATGGILLAEVQQISDITYRVYDWGRERNKATAREMHLDLAIDCIDYEKSDPSTIVYKKGSVVNPYFKIQSIKIENNYNRESNLFNSFIIYLCTEGKAHIVGGGISEELKKGETALIPASMGEYSIEGNCTLLEITACPVTE